MLDSPVIDIAIGLSFLYFLLGLTSSSVNELIQTILKSRSKELHNAIINFLDKDWDEIGNKIANSPYVRSISKSPDKFPSYIPSSSFAQGIIDVIKGEEDLPSTVPGIREKIKNNPIIKGDAQVWLLGLLDQSYDKVSEFYTRIEASYDEAMDRVSEWYGKNVKRTILLLGVVISVALNIDTIHIAGSLWQNKEMAKTLAALVASSMERVEKSESGFEIMNTNGEVLYSIKNSHEDNLSNVVAEIGTFPIPLGWGADSMAFLKQPSWGWEILSRIVGWAITSVAIFLGAPFWFDLLSKVVNLRGSGTKPEASKK